MKKNIKYVGAATIALMATAPVIVPTLVPTTSVKAYADINYNPKESATEMLTAFENQFDARYISGTKSLTTTLRSMATYNDHGPYGAYPYFDENRAQHMHDIQHDGGTNDQNGKGGIHAIKDGSKALSPNYFEDSNSDYLYRDIVGWFTISDKENGPEDLTTEKKIDDFCDRLDAGKVSLPLTIEFHIKTDGSYEKSGHPDSLANVPESLKSFTFTISYSGMNIVQDTSIPTITIGSTPSDTLLTNNDNKLQVTDNYTGDSTIDTSKMDIPKYGQSLFTSAADAMKYASQKNFDPTSTTATGAADVLGADGGITTANTYYQTVSYNLKDGNDPAIDYMLARGIDPMTKAEVSPYNTTVNSETATDGTDYVLNRDAGTITVVRSFNVSGTADYQLDPITVTVGTATDDSSLTNTDGDNLTIGKTNVISSGENVSFDNNTYYTDSKATVPATTDNVSSTFNKVKTYYRKVTFKLAKGNVKNLTFPGSISTDADKNTVTYVQAVNVLNSATPNISTPSVNVGTSVDSTDATQGNSLLSDNKSLVDSTNGVNFGSKYYQDGATDADVLGGKANLVTGVVDNQNNFAKIGTYLRTITFNLIDGVIDTNNFGTDKFKYNIDTQNNTVTYVQKVIINPLKAIVSFDAPNVSVGTTSDDLKLNDTTGDTLLDGNRKSIVDTSLGNNGIEFGKTYYSDNQLQNAVAGLDNKATYYRKITFHVKKGVIDNIDFNGTGATVNKKDNTVSFVQTINATSTSATVSYTDPINLTFGSAISDSRLVNDKSERVVDDITKKSILADTNGILLGTTYYDTAQDALLGDTTKVTKGITNDKFTNIQKLYRTVTLTLTPGSVAGHTFTNGGVKNVTNNTVTYAQEIDVTQATSKVAIADIHTHAGIFTNSLDDVEKDDYVLANDVGSLIANNGISFSDKYYDDSQSALEGGTNTTIGVKDGEFVKNGDSAKGTAYYRTITFKMIPGAAEQNTFAGVNGVDAKPVNDSITYVQKVVVAPNPATATIATAEADAGSLTKDLNSTDGNTLVSDIDKKSIVVTDNDGITFGDTYYDKESDVKVDGSGNPSKGISEGKFNAAGTYYRTVTFKLIQGAADAVDFKGDVISVDTDKNTVTYVQKVTINAVDATAEVVNVNTTAGTVAVGNPDLDITAGNDIKSKYGSIVAKDGITFGDKYYDEAKYALNPGTSTTQEIKDGKFSIGNKTYYRTITFKLDKNAAASNILQDKYHTEVVDNGETYVTYVQSINVSTNETTFTIGSPEVNAGTSLDSNNVISGNDIQAAGESIVDNNKGIEFGTTYYDSTATPEAVINGTEKKVDGVVNEGKLVKAGTYYRTVTFNLKAGSLMADEFDSSISTIDSTDSKNPKVTYYLQKIVVDSNPATITVPQLSVQSGVETSTTSNTDGDTLNSGTADSIATTVQAETTTYYKSSKGALKQDPKDIAIEAVSNGKFASAGSYYRRVTFTPASGVLDKYSFTDDNAQVNSDGTTITYAQAVTVGKNNATVNDSVKDLSVKVDVNGDNSALTDTKGYSLKDMYGNSLIDTTRGSGISFGQEYFTDNTLTTAATGAGGAKITIPGHYYRAVKFNLTDDATKENDFKSIGGTVDSTGTMVSFVQEVIASTNPVTATVKGTSVYSGSSTNSSELKNPNDVSIADSNGKSIIGTSGIKFGTTFFDDPTNAKHEGYPTKKVDANGNFTGAGPYYQTVTVPLVANGANAYEFAGDAVVDTKANTVTFVRAITIKPNQHSNSGSGSNHSSSSDNNDDEWTYYKNPGVVTTKTTQQYYDLNHKDNSMAKDRALVSNSSWVTDQYRTNREGVKQYRVATNEWIDSNDVYFIQNAHNNNDDEWTYYKNSGIVTTKTTQQYYDMNHKDDSMVSNRALGKDTAWITDQYRVNREGVKQYRVATNEWIDSNDVYFDQGTSATVLTDIQDIKGIVNVDATNTYYSLYNKDDVLVKSRALAEKTSWLTDKVAKDATGNTYYRVATNEWVEQTKGVYYSDNAWY